MNTFRDFWRAVTGKDRDMYRTLSVRASTAFEAHQRAVKRLNRAIDAHNKVERREELVRLRESRTLAHGARHMRGPFP